MTTPKSTVTNQNIQPKRILMMAAGTGGHVFPALAVSRQLQTQGHHVQWLGTPHGMENRLLEKETDIPMNHVAMQGMRGNGVVRLLKTPFILLGATIAAIKIIKTQKIDVVAGFGGYVAAPGGLAAKLLGVPLVIHEQNAIAGMTNSYLGKIATIVLEAFPNTFANKGVDLKKIQTVGNPIRLPIVELGESNKQKFSASDSLDEQQVTQEHSHIDKKLKVLVIGGSLGAKVLNDNVPRALALLDKPVDILHQCGQGHLEATEKNYTELDLTVCNHDYKVAEFVIDMAAAYEQTDLLICRAGASTVSEVSVAGVPAIFVPLPQAVDDHQTANAKFLSADGSAILLPQSELTPEKLAKKIIELTDDKLLTIRKGALQKGQPDSTCITAIAILSAVK